MLTPSLSPLSDEQIESALLAIVKKRGPGASACPSDVARDLCPLDWRHLMPRVRHLAARLAQNGSLDITQRGLVVAPIEPFKGPIRLRAKPANQ